MKNNRDDILINEIHYWLWKGTVFEPDKMNLTEETFLEWRAKFHTQSKVCFR